MDFQTQGVVLSYQDHGESDRVITVYSGDLGKIYATGRGVKKIKAKLAGHLELFNLIDLQLILKRNNNFLITSAVNIDSFPSIKNSVKKINIAFAISELTEKIVLEGQEDARIFNLITHSLKSLNDSSKNCELIYYYFAFRTLEFLGYRPELKKCVECQKSVSPKVIYFSFKHGGTTCSRCSEQQDQIQKITANTLKVIRLFFSRDLDLMEKLNFGADVTKELSLVTERYLQFVLGTEVNTKIKNHDSGGME